MKLQRSSEAPYDSIQEPIEWLRKQTGSKKHRQVLPFPLHLVGMLLELCAFALRIRPDFFRSSRCKLL